jgi:hypothetical protein
VTTSRSICVHKGPWLRSGRSVTLVIGTSLDTEHAGAQQPTQASRRPAATRRMALSLRQLVRGSSCPSGCAVVVIDVSHQGELECWCTHAGPAHVMGVRQVAHADEGAGAGAGPPATTTTGCVTCWWDPAAIASAMIQPMTVQPASRLSQKMPPEFLLPRLAAIAHGSR